MDECEHGDYAEEGWWCVDEALRCEDRKRYWTTDQQCASLLQRFLLQTVKNTLFLFLILPPNKTRGNKVAAKRLSLISCDSGTKCVD